MAASDNLAETEEAEKGLVIEVQTDTAMAVFFLRVNIVRFMKD